METGYKNYRCSLYDKETSTISRGYILFVSVYDGMYLEKWYNKPTATNLPESYYRAVNVTYAKMTVQ